MWYFGLCCFEWFLWKVQSIVSVKCESVEVNNARWIYALIIFSCAEYFVFVEHYSLLITWITLKPSDMLEMTSWFITSYSGVFLHYLNFPQVKPIQEYRVSHLEQPHCGSNTMWHSHLHYSNSAEDVIVIEKSGWQAKWGVLHPDAVIDTNVKRYQQMGSVTQSQQTHSTLTPTLLPWKL